MKRVDFYFDYASPFAYLASSTLRRKFGDLEVVYRPIYLRGLETFAGGLPYSSSKLAYLANDFQRVAAHERVAIAPPASFPIDGLHLLRGAFVTQDRGAFDRYHDAAFRAVWAQSRDVSTKELVAPLLAEALGATEAEAIAAMTAASVKARLRDETNAARERGVFGTPSFFVDDELFWGHDRMHYVARAAGLPTSSDAP